MRAQLLEKFNQEYRLCDLPKPPDPEGHDTLIEVHAASYCHTDAVFASGAMYQELPRVGSHEFAGKIMGLGSDVSSSLGLAQGQMVGVPGRAYHPCGNCYECNHNGDDPKGYGVWCPKAGNLGLSRDGGFQEFCIVDSRQVAPMPKALTALETAPLMCAGLTVWNALERAGVKMQEGGGNGMTVTISGAGGGIGHLGVQFAARLGCRVIAVDATGQAMELLTKVCVDLGDDGQRVSVVDARKSSTEEVKLQEFGTAEAGFEGEKGCDAAVILPESQEAFDFALKLLKNHSTCVCVSFPKDGFVINPQDLVFRHIDLVGVLVGRNGQLRAMLDFAAAKNVRATPKIYRLEDLNKLVQDYNSKIGGKLIVDMKL